MNRNAKAATIGGCLFVEIVLAPQQFVFSRVSRHDDWSPECDQWNDLPSDCNVKETDHA